MSKKEVAVVPTSELEISSPRYVGLVDECKRLKRQAGEGIVLFAHALYQAADELSRKEMQSLCGEVGILYDQSTYRKMLTIGQQFSRFKVHSDKVPNNWTTIYKLAALRPDRFEMVAKSDRFGTFMTAKDIDEILGDGRTKPTMKDSWSIIPTGLDQASRVKLFNVLKALRDQYRFKLKPDELEKISDASQSKQVA
jgi:hypothetical protein